jgi:hypothetical protein
VNLTESLEANADILGSNELINDLVWEFAVIFVVFGEGLEDNWLPAPMFQHLRGCFHKILNIVQHQKRKKTKTKEEENHFSVEPRLPPIF